MRDSVMLSHVNVDASILHDPHHRGLHNQVLEVLPGLCVCASYRAHPAHELHLTLSQDADLKPCPNSQQGDLA